MASETPSPDLSELSRKEISVLPASVLEPIIRQGHRDIGANEMTDQTMKAAINAVRRGHSCPGIPRSNGRRATQQEINDLFGG